MSTFNNPDYGFIDHVTITSLSLRDEDHRIDTMYLHYEGLHGGGGGVGGLILDAATLADMKQQLCVLFDIPKLTSALVAGKVCTFYRCFGTMSANVEVIECEGRRFSFRDFRKKHWPNDTPEDAIAEKKLELARDFAHLQRRLREIEKETAELPMKYRPIPVMK